MSESQSPVHSDKPIAANTPGTWVGRYVIRERLGSGGMGEVYLAMDTQLHRQVALKRVGPRFRNDEQYRRHLLNEARRASAFSDSHVAGIYDVLEHDEEFFIVMEYVDGITLRKRMEQPIDTAEFLRIAIQCTRGLSAAHENGIVHGDLKPENVMLSNRTSEIKICDFGLARRTFSPDHEVTGDSTTTEVVRKETFAGTPAYMAPEAFTGSATARTDIFSLGVTFYEMLSGRNPFRAPTVVATAQRIAAETPPPLGGTGGVPKNISIIVSRMLEKDPARRYTSAKELLAELEAAAGGSSTESTPIWKKAMVPVVIMASLAITLAAFFWNHLPRPTAPPAVAQTLVVLPFDTVGSLPAQHFQANGLSETLNAALVKLSAGRNLAVVPASDVQSRHVKNLDDARKELGATLVLVGSVQYFDNMVRVNCILMDGKSDNQLHAETVTVNAANPFLLQDRIVEASIKLLGIQLLPVELAAFQQHGTLQLGAYEYYVQGRGYLLNFDRMENLDSSIELFQKALQLDSKYSLAYAGLGEAYWRKFDTTKNNDLVPLSRAACQKAVSFGPKLAEAHLCLGTMYLGTGEYEKAVAEFNRSLELEPTMDIAYLNLGIAFDRLGQPENAEHTYRRAIDLKPQYWASYSALGVYYYKKKKYDLAQEMFLQVVSLAPDSYRGYSNLGVMYQRQNQKTKAIAAFKKSLLIRPNYEAASNLGTLAFYEGDNPEAVQAFREALSIDNHDHVVWGNLARALRWNGEQNESIGAYKEAKTRAEEKLKVNPRDAALMMHLAEYCGGVGSKGAALSYLRRALNEAPEDSSLLFNGAVIYEYDLKRREDALQLLRKAVEHGYPWKEIDSSPSLSELRTDPRYAELRNQQ